MLRISELKLPLDHAPEALAALIARTLDVPPDTVFKRSFDARKATSCRRSTSSTWHAGRSGARAAVLAQLDRHPHVARRPTCSGGRRSPWPAPPVRPVVIGFGPCGIFAALVLAQMGLKPIVLERGKTVRQRTKDTWGLWRKRELHPESNVQFGEGGAGTFSDGKLWSQIKDPRHLGRKVMTEFVKAGAPAEILYARIRTSAPSSW
jgi:uncharacterized FAD-dependent dehydrogenase